MNAKNQYYTWRPSATLVYTVGKQIHAILRVQVVKSFWSEFVTHPHWACEHGTCCWCRISRAPDWQSFQSSDTASSSLLPWKRWGARGRQRHPASLLLPVCRAWRMHPGQSPNTLWENTHNPPAGQENRKVKQSSCIMQVQYFQILNKWCLVKLSCGAKYKTRSF